MNPSIDIKFEVSSSLYYLHIKDLSCWGIAENLPAVIEITSPGYKKPYKSYFDKKDTTYDASNLGMFCDTGCTEVELSDGIYEIKLKASPDTFNYHTYYLKADQFERDFDKVVIKSYDNGDQNKDEIMEIFFVIKASEAQLRMGLVDKAGITFKEARKKLDRIIHCKNC